MASLDPFNMVKDFLYCGGPSVKPAAWFVSRESSLKGIQSWPQFERRTVIGTHRGRTAVALACRMLGLGSGDEVLMPAYHCGTELDALLYAGIKPVAYRVTQNCEIDLDDLVSRKTKRTRAVYLIHYFGWEQAMGPLHDWCVDQGLLLIEDCALALFSEGQTGSIGRIGDAAIYSLPKTLGTAHGGLLSLSAPPASGSPVLKPENTTDWLLEIRRSAHAGVLRALDKVGLCGALMAQRRHLTSRHAKSVDSSKLPDMPENYYFSPERDADRALHPRTAVLAGALDWEAIVNERRRNYQQMSAALELPEGCGLLFPSLPAGVCPLSMPLIVPHRDLCARLLQSRGIAAYPWWAGFHRGCVDWVQFKEARELKNKVLSLPVYQGLSLTQIDRLAVVVNKSLHDARRRRIF